MIYKGSLTVDIGKERSAESETKSDSLTRIAKCYLWITNLKILLNDEMISPLPLINYIYQSMKTEKEQ